MSLGFNAQCVAPLHRTWPFSACLPAVLALAAIFFLPQPVTAEPQDRQPDLDKDVIRRQLNIRDELSCDLRKGFSSVLFDFRIHSPYRVSFSLKDLQQSRRIFLRVWSQPLKDDRGKPFLPPKSPHYFAERYSLAEVRSQRSGFLQAGGSIATGAGEYEHFIAIDDGAGLGCVVSWKAKAKAPRALMPELTLAPGEVAEPRVLAFSRQAPVPKDPNGLKVAILLNADNRSWRRTVNDGNNIIALASTVRRIAEDPRVGEIALTAFSLEDQKVLYNQSFRETVNFRDFGRAFRMLQPGQVDLSELEARSEAKFLAGLLRDREAALAEADLVLFVGARSPVSDKVPPAALESLRPGNRAKVAYLITNPYRLHSRNGRDVIGHAVKALRGDELWIRLPEDLAKAVNSVIGEALQRQLSRNGMNSDSPR